MQGDFLILLILEVNSFVLRDAESRHGSLELLMEKMLHRGKTWKEEELEEWLGFFTVDAGSIALTARAIEHIERGAFFWRVLVVQRCTQGARNRALPGRKGC